MKVETSKTHFSIAVFLNRKSKASRDQVDGILRFAGERDDWDIYLFARPGSAADTRRLLRTIRPDGIISGSADVIAAFRRKYRARIPSVLIDDCSSRRAVADGIVLCADHAIGREAARFFLARKFQHFAFAGIAAADMADDAEFESFNSKNRENGFRRALARGGFVPAVYLEALPPGSCHYTDVRRLGDWLATLPKPCALLAHSDAIAQSVVYACARRRIAVPLQIAILGTNDEPSICENTRPTISSLAPDFAAGGFKAADMLNRLMTGFPAGRGSERTTYGTRELVERMSTRNTTGTRIRVARALEIIRTQALAGISAQGVADALGVSTRSLEIAFRNDSRKTVRDELIDVKLAEAVRLLAETRLYSSEIAARCGFRTANAFKATFAKRFGMSIRAWRKRSGT